MFDDRKIIIVWETTWWGFDFTNICRSKYFSVEVYAIFTNHSFFEIKVNSVCYSLRLTSFQ